MTEHRVLELGNPLLRQPAKPYQKAHRLKADILSSQLTRFRSKHGFGRAMAAPQIGFSIKMLALAVEEWPLIIVNPEICWQSSDTFTLWDDCMSFPELLVRVKRHKSISIRYQDLAGNDYESGPLEPSVSELLQHEIDHLHGILAIDLALDNSSIISRREFNANKPYFLGQIDVVTA